MKNSYSSSQQRTGWRRRCLFAPPTALLAAAAFLAGLSSARAFPFQDLPVPFTQPDGTPIEVRGTGDEFHAVFETPAGYTVVFDPALKAYCFAKLSSDGQLVSTGKLVHLANAAALGLPQHLRMSKETARQQGFARRRQWESDTGIRKRWEDLKAARRSATTLTQDGPQPAPPSSTTTGLKLGLTLLIDFDDDPATVPQAEIVRFCNGDNYSGFGNNGSVKKYYQDNSNGLLTYSNVVTIYIRIPDSLHPKSWYNDTSLDNGQQANLLVRDAVEIMKSLPNYQDEILPTFQNLTVDNNNQVVAFNVFYAGGNGGVWNKGLWPHSWVLKYAGAQELSPGGKSLWRYQITNIGSSLELGTFCHENGHMLCGFPDIYDYDYDSKGGAGIFCLMNSGGHGGNPTQICAYLKATSGWATITELTSSSSVTGTLTATAGLNFNHFYRFSKPGVPTEYFLLECRQDTGRDADLPGSGIAIWHIDELGDHDDQRMVPNNSHQNYEVTLVQADNEWDFERNANSGDSTDFYYNGNDSAAYRNEFSDTSSPSAQWWDGSPSGIALRAFSAPGATMTFQAGTGDGAPQIVQQPQSQTVVAGSSVTFSVNAAGTPQLKYQWAFNNAPLNGATDNAYTIQSVSEANQGSYSVRVSNGFGSADSQAATLTIHQGISLAAALDTVGLNWATGGNAPWEGQSAAAHDGTDAAQSTTLSDNQEAWMETSITGPGQLSFWWKVSSEEGYDFLEFAIDGVVQNGRISGEVDWQAMNYGIAAGNHQLRWRYAKDTGVSEGQDCGWVDQVVFVPESAGVPLADALDGPGLDWLSGGNAQWSGQTAITHDGIDAGQSGTISNNEDSYFETLISAGPGTLSFWWKVSSEENYDFLEFYVDGVLQNGRISGEVNWTQQTYSLAAGQHTLSWRYVKDQSASAGQDRAWVDQVSFVSATAQPPAFGAPKYLAGVFQSDVTGAPGAAYVILASSDLLTWKPLTTNTVPFTFKDQTAGQFSRRFYRATPAK